MVTAVGLAGTAPPDQFVLLVQSLFVAPVQAVCAVADPADKAMSTAMETLVGTRRRPIRALPRNGRG
jgi:hypothetical protein